MALCIYYLCWGGGFSEMGRECKQKPGPSEINAQVLRCCCKINNIHIQINIYKK